MRIRDLEWKDFPDLVAIYYRCYEERQQGVPIGIGLFVEKPSLGSEVDWFAGLYKRLLARKGVCLIAEEAGRAVGSCSVFPRVPDSEGAHVGVLGILLHPDHRGHGIGEKLMRLALERSKEFFEMIELDVFADNTRAKRLYAKLGFRTAGRLPKGLKREGSYVDVERMFLPLG